MPINRFHALVALLAMSSAPPAAAHELRNGGKLALTDGVSSVEGSAGGGLATWAVIAGAETDAGVGGSAHVTYLGLPDFDLTSYGAALGYRNRIELSYAHQDFDTRSAGARLGLGRGFTFAQDIYGAKVRLMGDAVYDQDRVLPQVALGVQHKRAAQGGVIGAIGGRSSHGTDFYLSATKVVLSKSLVVDGTVRMTKANWFGLLGFGGDKGNVYRAQFEGSAGLLLTRTLLVGGEYRTKPDNLELAEEGDAYDAFVAWSPVRHLTVTAAYVDLGSIVAFPRQRGAFLSFRGSY